MSVIPSFLLLLLISQGSKPKGTDPPAAKASPPKVKEDAAPKAANPPPPPKDAAAPATAATAATEVPPPTEAPATEASPPAVAATATAAPAEVAAAEPAAAAVVPPTTDDAAASDDRGKRVYVGNLAWQVSWQDLKDHMKSTGLSVVRANVITGPDGRSKGCGIVEFATATDAQLAVETLSDTELQGRPIFVREDREDKLQASGGGAGGGTAAATPAAAGAPSGGGHRFTVGDEAKGRRVYVGNLSWDVAWQDLKDYMKQAGDVVHTEIMTDAHSGRSKGCGLVEFATPEGAQAARDTLSNTEWRGRTIFVREDRESATATGGTVPGNKGGGGGAVGGAARHAGSNPSVYVWNLSPETSWQDLKDHMRKAGNVDSASVFVSPSGDSASGIVVYQKAQDAARAIRELQGTELHGAMMSLREDRMHSHSGRGGPGRGSGGAGGGGGGRGRGRGYGRGSGAGAGGSGGDRPEPGSQVFVGNLAYSTTWKELKDHFRQIGDVKRAEVKVNNQGQSKGFGVVQFVKKDDAEAAIERLNGSELQGRELEVRLDQKSH